MSNTYKLLIISCNIFLLMFLSACSTSYDVSGDYSESVYSGYGYPGYGYGYGAYNYDDDDDDYDRDFVRDYRRHYGRVNDPDRPVDGG
ncbi:MAG: hypothetical protein KAI17_22440, partial [Thiotrichaceae bacterium]|nr:hypothetical protein [Thiotrichaceae bacterium]